MSLSLGIRLLGGFSLTYGDRPVAGITRRSQVLLAYLVLHHHTVQPRRRIAFHLWPTSAGANARANLRRELSSLRHALPNSDQYLWTDAKTLQWLSNASFTLDVAEFEAAVQAAERLCSAFCVNRIQKYAFTLFQKRHTQNSDQSPILTREMLGNSPGAEC